MFQTLGAAVVEDTTEEDRSEERSAEEGGNKRIYVRDKETAPLSNSALEFHSRPFYDMYVCTPPPVNIYPHNIAFHYHTVLFSSVVPSKESQFRVIPGFR